MKFSTLLLPVLAATAFAAPTKRDEAPLGDSAGSLNELFHLEGDVLVGPGGYFDSNGFHPEEYKGGAEKRDAAPVQHEERGVAPGMRVLGHGWRVRYGVVIGPNAWWGPSGWHYGRYPYGRGYHWW